MAEMKAALDDQDARGEAAPSSNWRNAFMAAGCFCVLGALMVGAGMKGAAGAAPKVLAFGGFALIVISSIWSLVSRILHSGSPGAGAKG